MLALTEEMAEKGITRLPDLVLTMNEAMRERSSWGASVTSRTRPLAAPDGSYTVAPSSSESGSVFIPAKDSRVLREREMKCQTEPKNSSKRLMRVIQWRLQRLTPAIKWRPYAASLNRCATQKRTAHISAIVSN